VTAVQPNAPGATPPPPELADGVWRVGLGWVPGALLLAGATAAVRSVPNYDNRIVATYAVLWVALAVAVFARWRVGVTGRLWNALVVAASGAVVWLVPTFTYVPAAEARALRGVLAVGTLVVALVLGLLPRWHRPVALVLAAALFVYMAATVIRLDPLPKIDTWYTVQQAANATFHGRSMYGRLWEGPPEHFMPYTYLPWTAVLLTPFRVLFGDVRWGLAVAQLVGAGVVAMLARTRPAGRARPVTSPGAGRRADTATTAAVLLLLLPGTSTSIEQSWTEPLVFALTALCLLAVARGLSWQAVLALALALASKQHVALLLPLFAVWRPFGVRRTVLAALGAAALVAPWVVATPRGMLHDAVSVLLDWPPIRFSDTLYLAAIKNLAWTPPFWLTGLLVVAIVGSAAWAVRGFDLSPARFAAVAAFTLFGANLLNKQAFYNQYWFVAALVLLAWAAPGRERAADVGLLDSDVDSDEGSHDARHNASDGASDRTAHEDQPAGALAPERT
jgi:hypothetical protein